MGILVDGKEEFFLQFNEKSKSEVIFDLHVKKNKQLIYASIPINKYIWQTTIYWDSPVNRQIPIGHFENNFRKVARGHYLDQNCHSV